MNTVIALLFSAIDHTVSLIQKYRAAAQQAGEWTPAQEAEYKAKRDAITSQDHWKIEP